MSNLLTIPFKKTYDLDIKHAASEYLHAHTAVHPNAFRTDISQWHQLRIEAVREVVDESRVQSIFRYHAQLVAILTKLPLDIQLGIPYAPAFSPSSPPLVLNNLFFELASLIFNLAALYSQLAAADDRSHVEGLKLAIANYQNAAGALAFLRTSILSKLDASVHERAQDISPSFIFSLEKLMLAQAQECIWQKAKLGNMKDAVIARLAANVASLYSVSLTTIYEGKPPVKHVFPQEWLAHIRAKQHHFDAVAQFRKSVDEISVQKYGNEIARLSQARHEAGLAFDIARKGHVSATVVQDIQSLLQEVQRQLNRAERDNDLIYHQEVPAFASLPQIQHAALAQLTIPPQLTNPSSLLPPNHAIFGELLGWGAREAIDIYEDRKKNLIQDKIINAVQSLKDQSKESLASMNLPSSLESSERTTGLPASLLKQINEVQQESGPDRIRRCMKDVQRLAQLDRGILDNILDILDTEATEDEEARNEVALARPLSHEANVSLVEKVSKFRKTLDDASRSDQLVRSKWEDWEKNIMELMWDVNVLEKSIPSATSYKAPSNPELRKHAEQLRSYLEELDSLHRLCDQQILRAQALGKADNIRPQVLKKASGLEQLASVGPEWFEDISDEQLSKYDHFLQEIQDALDTQETLIAKITRENDLFNQARREDPTNTERTRALQSLDFSYHKYKEILQNLEEGIAFYNRVAEMLEGFRNSCKDWCDQRREEIDMAKLAAQTRRIEISDKAPLRQRDSHPIAEASAGSLNSNISSLPPLTSSEWEFEELVLPPPPPRR